MYIVAGVTGHVGSVVARDLLAKHAKLKVIVRSAEKGAAWSKQGAEVAVGSLDDAAFLTTALKGATGFFVLLPPNVQATDFFADQKRTADAIASAVKSSSVKHVVMLSSVGANHPAGTGPIKGLHYLENVLRTTGTTLTAVRAGSFQENIAMAFVPAKQMGIFANFAPSADYPMPQIASRDIGHLAAELLLAGPTKSEVVDLHGPAYSNREAAEKLGKALGKTLQVIDVPASAHLETLMQAGLPKPVAEQYAEMYDGAAKGLLTPAGDRLVQGKTTLDETIKNLL
ncbi:MAG: NmrA family NAD(P)-binding protein [Deltaproteobacteria bacterium]